MNKIEESERFSQESATYNAMFETGGDSGIFDLPYKRSPYYPLYQEVFRTIKRLGADNVLEVGCGTGGLAHFLLEKTLLQYHGFDFSEVAVNKAIQRTGRKDLFNVGDATFASSYPDSYEAIICTEVLEHVPEDRKIIEHWAKGTKIICSVPNFDSRYHVRVFKTDAEVCERYGDLIDIDSVSQIKKPVVNDLSWRNRLRQLRWNRYRPKRIVELLGLGDFDKVGGWFVVRGTRK
ncbi:MAG: class I SAM-dependent methyltransferase [Candidatus Polarisedimenticolaceae bacterium]|nr:class I SAM-dependent methyltransferase [Candidatus Polarisedimenticolaceae bacterium]